MKKLGKIMICGGIISAGICFIVGQTTLILGYTGLIYDKHTVGWIAVITGIMTIIFALIGFGGVTNC